MGLPETPDGKPYNYALLHLATEQRAGEAAVRHFICLDCLEPVEGSATTHLHDCPATVEPNDEGLGASVSAVPMAMAVGNLGL